MPEHILIADTANHTATITLNRPEKKNALSTALRDEVTDALADLAQRDDLKAVVITGAGNIFSAGFDLTEFQTAADDPDFHKQLWDSSDRYHHACLNFPLPLIAAINGPAIAGGFDLATLCDIRIAAETAWFSHPEIAFGDVMYGPLRELIGASAARELCLTGRKVDAQDAKEMGLVTTVVPIDELPHAVEQLTQAIAQAPRENLLRTKAKFIRHAQIDHLSTLDL